MEGSIPICDDICLVPYVRSQQIIFENSVPMRHLVSVP